MGLLGLCCYSQVFSSCSEQGLLFIVVCGLLTVMFLLFPSMGSRAQIRQLWHTGLVTPKHVGSSWTRDRTTVSCIGRRILNH